MTDFPDFQNLRARHPRLSVHSSGFLAETARVSLSRHHTSPTVLQVSVDQGTQEGRRATWDGPSPEEKTSHGNTDNATEYGAYCLAIAAVEQEMDLYAIGRTERKTGADYYMDSNPAAENNDASHVVEISGIDVGTEGDLKSRLKEKVEQIERGAENRPGIAVVVGFSEARILVKTV